MVQFAEIRVPGDGFPLGQILSELPDVAVDLERLVPSSRVIFPYFWVRGVSPGRVAGIVGPQEGLRSIEIVDTIGDMGLFRAEWSDDVHGITRGLVDTDVTLLRATGTGDEWRFALRGETEALSAFNDYCEEHDIPITVVRIQPYAAVGPGGEFQLTDDQREALLLAFDAGYYEEPRETTLADLASELDISRQAFAARLRRGYGALIAQTLAGA